MRKIAAATLLAGLIAGCATTNAFVRMKPDFQDIPQEALEAVALDIEQAVANEDREAVITGRGGVVVDTPAVRQAIRTRAARHQLLSELLDTGYLYEGNAGTVYIERNSAYKKATTRQDRDRHAMLVLGENTSRWAIYEGILEASNFPPRSLSAIQETFFKARLSIMKPGQRYEDASGEIVAK